MELREEIKIDQIAEKLSKIVILDEDIWQLILYSVLSPYAPKIRINGVPVRSNLHTLLVGDVATAKSRICRIVEEISPKASRITKVTEASLEGVFRVKGYIELGLIDVCNDGMLIIPEFTTVYQKYKILREVMDCETVTIIKGGETKQVDVNISFFTGSNPSEDFFHRGRLRKQIPFREGILTRFDIVIPLTSTCERNRLLLDHINIFGDYAEEVDLSRIRSMLNILAERMSKVREVTLSPEQKETVRDVFLRHNNRLPNRPLLLMRDLEIISRLIDVITATGFNGEDQYFSVASATIDDVEKAVELWETLIDLRKSLYIGIEKEILSVDEKIFKQIAELGKVKTKRLEEIIVDSQNLCSKATFYRKIKQLKSEGKIKQNALRDGEVYPA